jgi:hypothetical protein
LLLTGTLPPTLALKAAGRSRSWALDHRPAVADRDSLSPRRHCAKPLVRRRLVECAGDDVAKGRKDEADQANCRLESVPTADEITSILDYIKGRWSDRPRNDQAARSQAGPQ